MMSLPGRAASVNTVAVGLATRGDRKVATTQLRKCLHVRGAMPLPRFVGSLRQPEHHWKNHMGVTCIVTGGGGGITSEATPNPNNTVDWYGEAQHLALLCESCLVSGYDRSSGK